MSGPESFLERWSRRKREATDVPAPEAAEQPREDKAGEQSAAAPPAAPATGASEEAFDPATLPSIESISADTDIRDFLRPGVPPDLTRAALRRAWTSDPAIRDFMGPVENGWDFNDPNAMAGFGSLAAEDVPRLLAQVFGATDEAKLPPDKPLQAKQTRVESTPSRDASGEATPQKVSDQTSSLQRSEDVAAPKDAAS